MPWWRSGWAEQVVRELAESEAIEREIQESLLTDLNPDLARKIMDYVKAPDEDTRNEIDAEIHTIRNDQARGIVQRWIGRRKGDRRR